MKQHLFFLGLLLMGLVGCVPIATQPSVESIQAGGLVSQDIREKCPTVVQRCRTSAAQAVQTAVTDTLRRMRGNQDLFDQQFIACVRDQERGCAPNQIVQQQGTDTDRIASSPVQKSTKRRHRK